MKPIVVAGSINMDLILRLESMPAHGETVVAKDIQYIPGGKGSNQAIAASRLSNGPVALIGKLGQDAFGDQLFGFLSIENLILDGVTRCSSPSGTAIVTIDASTENAIMVAPGANFELSTSDIDHMQDSIAGAAVAITQLEIPLPVAERFFNIAKRHELITILNAAPARNLSSSFLSKADYLVVNETELAFLAGKRQVSGGTSEVIEAARQVQAQGPPNVVVTLGANGSITLSATDTIVIEGLKVDAVDPTGAGDCFVGALAAQLAKGVDLRQSLDYANRASALTVQHLGASSSIPYKSQLEAIEGCPYN